MLLIHDSIIQYFFEATFLDVTFNFAIGLSD